MDFATYLNQAWDEHATHANKVASGFTDALTLVNTNQELGDLAWLVTHIFGEHLGRWNEGVLFLENLKAHKVFEPGSDTDKMILRHTASLQIGGGLNPALEVFTISEQIRIISGAASALATTDVERAQSLIKKALNLAELHLDKKDPANRSLAITGNNLACALEEIKDRSPQQTELMILAALTARKYWEIAGTWLEVERAEYRLAMTYLQAADLPRAFNHAQACAELCLANKAGDLDMFYAYEALALVEQKRQNDLGFKAALLQAESYFKKLDEANQIWCKESLHKLRGL